MSIYAVQHYEVKCDTCSNELGAEDFDIGWFAAEGDAKDHMEEMGWLVSAEGVVECETCKLKRLRKAANEVKS